MSGGRGAGNPPLTYEGDYDTAQTYLPRQVVKVAGKAFMSLAKQTGVDPPGPSWLTLGSGSRTETVNVVAASGAAVTLPEPDVASISHVTLTANCTFTFPTLDAGESFTLTLVQDATGSRTATWPSSVKWPDDTPPTLTATAGSADVVRFLSDDGIIWRGFILGQNYSPPPSFLDDFNRSDRALTDNGWTPSVIAGGGPRYASGYSALSVSGTDPFPWSVHTPASDNFGIYYRYPLAYPGQPDADRQSQTSGTSDASGDYSMANSKSPFNSAPSAIVLGKGTVAVARYGSDTDVASILAYRGLTDGTTNVGTPANIVGDKVTTTDGPQASKQVASHTRDLDVSVTVTVPGSGGSSSASVSLYIGDPTFAASVFVARMYADGTAARRYYSSVAESAIGTGYTGTHTLRVTIDTAGMGSGGGGTAKVYVDGALLDTLTGINLGGHGEVTLYVDTTTASADNFTIV